MTTFPYTTPILGIVNQIDRVHQGMVAVVYGNPESLKWSYVAPGHGRISGLRLSNPESFTPLKTFGIKYGMTSDGRLRLERRTISQAKYPDGSHRDWKGANETIIDVMPAIAAKVWGAVHSESPHARRAKPAARASA